MADPTLKSALNYYLQSAKLVEEQADRAHLTRWLNEAHDPVWEQIAADIRRYGELGPFFEGPYSVFIGAALRARRVAESQTDTPAVERKRKQQRVQQDHLDLLALAEKMDVVVQHRQSCKKAQHLQRIPSPTGPLPDLREEAEAKQALEWLGREAQRLRQLAKNESAGEPNWDWGPITVRASRQSGGKGKRAHSREQGVHAEDGQLDVYQYCGKPRYNAVSLITNIAFPKADVVAEDVRSACRTANGRSGALRQ